MSDKVQILFGLFAGLAIFIYGMNLMSECLQKAAGEKMRTILSMLTGNPILGVLAGAVTTAVLQSSSATTVMVIGFVSAGLMSLPQAVSIILGANIGTTMTAQIIAFKITDYIYVFIFAGFLIHFLCKKEKAKYIGQTIFAFGLLFEGISIMESVMKPLADSPFFTELLGKVSDIPILGVAVGTLMTVVVQSSSATIAVLQNFASQPGPDGVSSIIGLTGAIPILLGDNIGTTITALLASIGQSKDAKRTAVAHSVFNISGAFLFIWLVKPYAALIRLISPKGAEVEVISRQIANAHTGFNLMMTLLWLPFIGVLVQIVMRIIPDRADRREILLPSAPQFLDGRLIAQPTAALHLATKEVLRCSAMVEEMLTRIKNDRGDGEEQILLQVIECADTEHTLCDHINDYFAAMFAEGVMTETQVGESAGLMYALCDIDRMGMLCRDITEAVLSQDDKKYRLSKEARKDLKKAVELILEMYVYVGQMMMSGDADGMNYVLSKREEIRQLDERMRKAHIERVGKKKCRVELTGLYDGILHNIDRMANTCVNLADTAGSSVDLRRLLVDG